MGFTKNTPPCGQPGNASSFSTVVDSKQNTTQDWRAAGKTDCKQVLSTQPAKNPIKPEDVQNP